MSEKARDPKGETSYHVGRAREGDESSWGYLVERLNPLLRAQAEYRLRPPLRNLYDPDDIVSEAWRIALRQINSIEPRDGRYTPVFLRFLSSCILRIVLGLMQKHARGKPQKVEFSNDEFDVFAGLPAPNESVGHRARDEERKQALWRALQDLTDEQREVIVLRGIEQIPNGEVAKTLGLSPSAATMRYQRALAQLRKLMPDSVADELNSA